MYGPNCNTPPTRLSLLHFSILPLAKGTTPLGSMRRGVYSLFNWDNFGGHFMVHYVFLLLIRDQGLVAYQEKKHFFPLST